MRYYYLPFFATVIWGAAYPFTKYVINQISPLNLVFIRTFVSVIILFFLTKEKFKKHEFNLNFILKLFFMSIIGVSFQQYIQAYALKYTLASNAGWLITLTPIIVVVIQIFLGEKISFLKILGFLLGFSGAFAVVISQSGFKNFSLISTKGDWIFISSCFAWAFYVVLTRKWFSNKKQDFITFWTMFIALISLIPFLFSSNLYFEISNLNSNGWICIFYLSVLSSALAYFFWNKSVELIGPVKSSYFIYSQPFSAMISSSLLLGEKISIITISGGFLILAGVYLVREKENG